MTPRDRAIRALRAWVDAHNRGREAAVPIAGEHDHSFELQFDEALVSAIEAEIEELQDELDDVADRARERDLYA